MNSGYFGDDLLQHNAGGSLQRRIYLDSAATSLSSRHVHGAMEAFMPNYGSFHSDGHFSAAISMEAFTWAKRQVLEFLGAAESEYEVVFVGSGATAAINRLAAGLASVRGQRDIAVVSLMEHHSNDLPHRQHSPRVIHLPVDAATGWRVDLGRLADLLARHGSEIHYVAVTAASNVTGLLNPIADITRLAHAHGVKVLVDGAQVYAHHPFSMSDPGGQGVDFFVLSGHKAHAPFAPGAFVARKSLLAAMPPLFFGGGMVGDVNRHEFSVSECMAKKEHAGTPSIAGAFSLGLATDFLAQEGIGAIARAEQALRKRFLDGAASRQNLRTYASQDGAEPCLGIVVFNLGHVPPNLLAAILNDHFCIAVRAGCFCAHPYVRELLFDDFLELPDSADPEDHRGMVRISLGPHNTPEDIDRLLEALGEIDRDIAALRQPYTRMPDGQFSRTGSEQRPRKFFDQFIRAHGRVACASVGHVE